MATGLAVAAPAAVGLPALLALRPLDRELTRMAGRLEPRALRSLGAIHLATALTLDPAPGAFFTYDIRLVAAAQANGLHVEAPS